jgi:cytochrome c oxidase subunit 2
MRGLPISAAVAAITTGLSVFATTALAEAGKPRPWQMNFQDTITGPGRDGADFHNMLLILITAISIFVLGLLIYVMVKFNAKANPTPSKTTHNTLLEVVWTVVPVIILVIVAVPSFKLLYYQDVVPKTEMTIKAIGHQWYWSYEYPDHGDFTFDATMLEEDELEDGQLRLLETDTEVVVPVNTNIRLLLTADDVIHAWAIPSLYVKKDAVPGKMNEIWFNAEKEGVYYGQCSELCGVRHGFMPIKLRVVSKDAFAAWVEKAKVEYAQVDQDNNVKVAARK